MRWLEGHFPTERVPPIERTSRFRSDGRRVSSSSPLAIEARWAHVSHPFAAHGFIGHVLDGRACYHRSSPPGGS